MQSFLLRVCTKQGKLPQIKRMDSKTKSQNATKFSKAKLAKLAIQPSTKKFSAAGQPAGITSTMLGENSYNPQTSTDPFPSMTHFSPSKMHEMENDDRSSSISDTDDSYNLQLKGDKLGVKPAPGKKTRGRVKIQMEYIQNKLRRYTTFSKRKSGIMKKAYELSTLTGTQVMLLVASETGHVYTFATPKLQPMITSETGKALIQTCLHQPDPPNAGVPSDYDMRMSANGYEETELGYQVPEEDFKGNIHDPCMVPVSSSSAGIPIMPINGMSHGMIPMQGFAAMPPEMSIMTHAQMVPTHQTTQVMSPQHSSPPPSYSPPGHPASPHRATTFSNNSYPSSPPSVSNFSQQGPPHHQQVMMEEIPYDQRSPSQSPIQHRYSHSPPQGGLYANSNGSPTVARM